MPFSGETAGPALPGLPRKRTYPGHAEIDANDPTETSTWAIRCIIVALSSEGIIR
jgi:hypothetical protein